MSTVENGSTGWKETVYTHYTNTEGAKVGYVRIEETENPELAHEKMKEIDERNRYPKDWIDKRLRGIAIRQNLTDEWKERGIEKQRDYVILTAEISKATFGMTPNEYKKLKNLPEK